MSSSEQQSQGSTSSASSSEAQSSETQEKIQNNIQLSDSVSSPGEYMKHQTDSKSESVASETSSEATLMSPNPRKEIDTNTSISPTPESPAPDETSSSSDSSESSDDLSRQLPIPPASEPKQYRAIGLIYGKYMPSDEQFTRGNLLSAEGQQIDSVLLGRVMSLVKKHVDLEKPHLWVVYPRTRIKDRHLHLQIVGVWEPEKLNRSDIDQMEDSHADEAISGDAALQISGQSIVDTSTVDASIVVEPSSGVEQSGEVSESAPLVTESGATDTTTANALSEDADSSDVTDTIETASTETASTETASTETISEVADTSEVMDSSEDADSSDVTDTIETASTETPSTEPVSEDANRSDVTDTSESIPQVTVTSEAIASSTGEDASSPSSIAEPEESNSTGEVTAEQPIQVEAEPKNADDKSGFEPPVPFLEGDHEILKDGYFSIRGEVIKAEDDGEITVKIRQAPRKGTTQPRTFNLVLKGSLDGKVMGYFWDLNVQREGIDLVIQDGSMVGIVLPKKRSKKPGRGGRGPGGPRGRGGPSGGKRRWNNNSRPIKGDRPERPEAPRRQPISKSQRAAIEKPQTNPNSN